MYWMSYTDQASWIELAGSLYSMQEEEALVAVKKYLSVQQGEFKAAKAISYWIQARNTTQGIFKCHYRVSSFLGVGIEFTVYQAYFSVSQMP